MKSSTITVTRRLQSLWTPPRTSSSISHSLRVPRTHCPFHTSGCSLKNRQARQHIAMSSPPEPSRLDPNDGSFNPLPSTSSHATSATKDAKEKRPAPTHFLCLPLYPQSIAIFSPPPPPVPVPNATTAGTSKSGSTLRPSSLLPNTQAHDSLKRNLKQFLSDEGEVDEQRSGTMDDGARIPRDAFRPFGTLHLTLGVMSLRGDDVSKAVDVLDSIDLRSLVQNAFSSGGVEINPESNKKKLLLSLRGLRTMQSARKTTVLYSHPTSHPQPSPPTTKENEDVVYIFALSLREHFISKGLITPESRPFTLHATIINTIYSKSSSLSSSSSSSSKSKRGGKKGGRGGRHGKGDKLVIDATDLLDKYHDKVFVEGLEIDRVELCKMGAKKGEEVVDDEGGTEVVGAGYEVIAWRAV